MKITNQMSVDEAKLKELSKKMRELLVEYQQPILIMNGLEIKGEKLDVTELDHWTITNNYFPRAGTLLVADEEPL